MRVDPSDMTDDELLATIDQLGAEVSMPGPSPTDDLDAAQAEADDRGLFY